MAPHPLTPSLPPLWRLGNPCTHREVVLAAEPGVQYIDREDGSELEVTGQLLPLAPSPSRLAWAPENLRFCPACDRLVAKDLNHCPYDGRPLPPLDRPASAADLGATPTPLVSADVEVEAAPRPSATVPDHPGGPSTAHEPVTQS